MLTYGFQLHAINNISIHHDELQSTENSPKDMQDMLHLTLDNIKTG